MQLLINLQESLPSYAKDIKLNLSNLQNDMNLTQQQLWGTMLTCAMTAKNPYLLQAILEVAESKLSLEALHAAKIAATLMAMNNVYYRFTHAVSNKDYNQISANLRMTMMLEHGIDKVDFELYALAVSAINGCGYCMDAHEKILANKGLGKETIQAAVRIAAVISAVSLVLSNEKILEPA